MVTVLLAQAMLTCTDLRALSSFGVAAVCLQGDPGGQINIMLRATISLFVIACVLAIIAAIFGFGGFAAGAAGVAKTLFYIAVGVAVIAMIGALLFGRRQEV